MQARTLAVALIFLTSACSREANPSPAADADRAFYTDRPMNELMHHVIDYSAEGIWKWEGWVSDENGRRSLFPSNDEEWEQAESAAQTLSELTNVLLLPGRKVDDPRWTSAVLKVRGAALDLAEAAKKQDQDRFFQVGGELDDACESCHVAFVPQPAPDKGPNSPLDSTGRADDE